MTTYIWGEIFDEEEEAPKKPEAPLTWDPKPGPCLCNIRVLATQGHETGCRWKTYKDFQDKLKRQENYTKEKES